MKTKAGLIKPALYALVVCLVLPYAAACSGGYSVTFVYGYGGKKDEFTGVSGKISEPETESRTGYDFCGWYYTGPDGEKKYWDFEADEISKNTVLIADWQPRSVSIFLDPDGGTIAEDTVVATYGDNIAIPEPEKEGHWFIGWTERDRETVFAAKDVTFENDLYLKAVWLPFDPDAVITFGRFEQDNDPTNGPEPVEWVILDKTGDAYLLLSLKVLDAQPYDPVPLSERKTSPAWSDCALQGWLNGDFYRTAFTDAERAQILPRTFDDISVTDYVSLISTSEKKTLLDARRKELCFAEATEYALSRGLRLDNNRGDDWYCWWWLRQEKNNLTNDSLRYPHGFLGWGAGNDYSCLYGVRPSIVVKSDSIN